MSAYVGSSKNLKDLKDWFTSGINKWDESVAFR